MVPYVVYYFINKCQNNITVYKLKQLIYVCYTDQSLIQSSEFYQTTPRLDVIRVTVLSIFRFWGVLEAKTRL